jgi:hypothetical protein
LVCHLLGVPPGQGEKPMAALQRVDATRLQSQAKHKQASHMLEAVCLGCPPPLYEPLASALVPALPSLAVNPIANFAVQALVAAAPAARHVGDAFAALRPTLPDLLFRGRSGVAATLAAACAAWRVQCDACCAAVRACFSDSVRPHSCPRSP